VLGGGAVVIDDDQGGCFAMKTIPDSRRRGVASNVLHELVVAAGALGVTGAWLQVDEANGAARSLYERFGFTVAHGYRYRVAP
jgi:ribosomal protein S18 acetylase RimI-like enzyme